MYRHYLQCWWVLFFLPVLTHTAYVISLWCMAFTHQHWFSCSLAHLLKFYYILTLDRAVNQRCTCVNKQKKKKKKKRKQVAVMKEYRQMPAAVETAGVGRPEREPACKLRTPLRAVTLSDPRLNNPSQDAEEVPSGFLKITQRAMVKKRSWVNIAVCPCLHTSLTHHRNINPFENKVREICFYKEVCSFVYWSS